MVYTMPTTYMAHFNRDNKGGRGKFGKKSFGGRDNRPQMHDATCNKCGKRCQVPFRPTGERPVYCSDCFEKERGDSMPQRNEGRDFGHKDRGGFHSEERRMYSATCDNCGKKCEVPFMPSEGRKTYCKECFDNGAAGERKNRDSRTNATNNNVNKTVDSYKGQFEALNKKLDEILHVLTPKSADKPVKKKPVKKAVAPKKTKKK
ncbi:MAG: hypothetical protein A3J55_02395 [Candidatus Ryanbacteria bacterium RIFCSPHIGHO2_02_FULL_45_17b]|uniref:CxxC-x17-CxxC domain-containing protein n=1 Tax=Candidatus Ryanbacteria bacterium RIFCSPHIGHO2_01_FULL_45_22 TaxID=1802114 RepID=A0A1G2FYS8_9BACT|nr:MAG: hypothetical protein A2719_00835 [Candidatus Ryanbacteria bacterium RIFCSPHIGHO2_01_FULL_45_22]OGZ46780.1 MAG: hypothetical protein A3J55_02395 [Candidatus Ryanbacteria bacterium RIFCSPHIGHO2_02_FULL_45_17b]